MPFHGKDKLAKDICEALGLKHVKRLDISLGIDRVTTVTAEYYPEKKGMMQFPAILKEFKLVDKDAVILEDKTVIGDEWKSFKPFEREEG